MFRSLLESALGVDMEQQNLTHEDGARGIFRVHRSAFTSLEIAAIERNTIFDRCWLYLGHESEVEKPGDFRRRTVAGRPLFWVRGSDGKVRAFHNTCTHWGANVCRVDQGNTIAGFTLSASIRMSPNSPTISAEPRSTWT